MVKPYIIGITGGTGSGKSRFLKLLLEDFEYHQVTCLPQDDYYRPREQQLVDKNGELNFDRPESIDYEHFANDLKALASGKPVEKMEYTFNNPDIEPAILIRKPAPVIIVEGIFVLHYAKVVEQLDLKIFIDAKDTVKLQRRLTRDREERGYGAEDVMYKYENHILPSYEKYIAPHKENADIVIPNNTDFLKALEVIKILIAARLA